MRSMETERLIIEEFSPNDAKFMLLLLNDPAFIRHIGDRQVRTLAQAEAYLLNGPIASYHNHGFGMFAVRLKNSSEQIGSCGLVRREPLTSPDIGYAFLPNARGQGYAREAASRIMQLATTELKLPELLAIVSPGNRRSRALLEKLGLRYQQMIRLSTDDDKICLYRWRAENTA